VEDAPPDPVALHGQFIDLFRELLKACGYFTDNLWHVEDVHFICEQRDLPPISDEEAMEVFAIAGERFDGNALAEEFFPDVTKVMHSC
jgi:hypothetical protein